MIFLAANWGWLLAVALIMIGSGTALQLKNVKNVMNGKQLDNMMNGENPFKYMVRGMLPVIVCFLIATFTGVLSIVGIIAALTN